MEIQFDDEERVELAIGENGLNYSLAQTKVRSISFHVPEAFGEIDDGFTIKGLRRPNRYSWGEMEREMLRPDRLEGCQEHFERQSGGFGLTFAAVAGGKFVAG